MVDKISLLQRSANMAAVRSKNTEIEQTVRSILHGLGLRFRLHDKALPGSPDIVLRRHATVVMVHGCFWHGHGCSRGKPPSSRSDFWLPKLQGNRRRDRRNADALRRLGWRVITVWECESKNRAKLEHRLARLFRIDDQRKGPRQCS
nr:DNA mismatch endonuclease Vsr [Variovorax sp. YR216]